MSNHKPQNPPPPQAQNEKVKNISAIAWEKNYQFSSREQQFLQSIESKSIVTKSQNEFNSITQAAKPFPKNSGSLKDATSPNQIKNLPSGGVSVNKLNPKEKGKTDILQLPLMCNEPETIKNLLVEKYDLMKSTEA